MQAAIPILTIHEAPNWLARIHCRMQLFGTQPKPQKRTVLGAFAAAASLPNCWLCVALTLPSPPHSRCSLPLPGRRFLEEPTTRSPVPRRATRGKRAYTHHQATGGPITATNSPTTLFPLAPNQAKVNGKPILGLRTVSPPSQHLL